MTMELGNEAMKKMKSGRFLVWMYIAPSPSHFSAAYHKIYRMFLLCKLLQWVLTKYPTRVGDFFG